jgi:hypothetical protein
MDWTCAAQVQREASKVAAMLHELREGVDTDGSSGEWQRTAHSSGDIPACHTLP